MGTRGNRSPAAVIATMGVAVCLTGAACSTATPASPSTAQAFSPPVQTSSWSATPATASGCLVGATWSNWAEIERFDGPATQNAVMDAGARFEAVDARSSVIEQARQIDAFVAKGARVIIVQPASETDEGLVRAVDRAADAGVAVIAYERIIESPSVLFVAFDEVEAGRVEARGLLAAKPRGDYVIIRFVEGTNWDTFHAVGLHEVLQPAVDRGDIKIVAEIDGGFWNGNLALQKLGAVLKQNHNKVDAVTWDWFYPQGIRETLANAGVHGQVAVAYQGGDKPNLNDIALGTETLVVWRDQRLTGKTAGDAAVALCSNPDIARLSGTSPFSSPGHNRFPSILIKPQAITKDNLQLVIDSGWVAKEEICASVPPSMTPACP